MNKLKKMIAVLMSVAMIACMFTVSASAASIFDGAIRINPTETVSHSFKNDTEVLYKIVLSDSGKITFYCSDYDNFYGSYSPRFSLLDSSGNTVIKRDGMNSMMNRQYTINKKGTYYIKVEDYESGHYFKNLYYGYEQDSTPSLSLVITMKVGDKIDFSTVASNYKGNVTWKTTKSSVATVSKGTVTAKKKGTAQIRAYMDNGDYAEITVKVKK